MCLSAFDGLSLNGPVDSGAGDVEQLGEFGGGMRARAVDFLQMALQSHRQFGLLAAQVTLRFSHLHPFS